MFSISEAVLSIWLIKEIDRTLIQRVRDSAKIIKEFRGKSDRPILKGAYVEETIYIGDNNLETLANIKSKNELIADVVALLQSPAKRVVSALQNHAEKKDAA